MNAETHLLLKQKVPKISSDHNSRSLKPIPVCSIGNLSFTIPIVFSTTTRALQSFWLNMAFPRSFTITSVKNGVHRKGRSRWRDVDYTVLRIHSLRNILYTLANWILPPWNLKRISPFKKVLGIVEIKTSWEILKRKWRNFIKLKE